MTARPLLLSVPEVRAVLREIEAPDTVAAIPAIATGGGMTKEG